MDAEGQRCTRAAEQVAAFLRRAGDQGDSGARIDSEEHLQACPQCAEIVRRLRAEPAVSPDLELRLLRTFREWRT